MITGMEEGRMMGGFETDVWPEWWWGGALEIENSNTTGSGVISSHCFGGDGKRDKGWGYELLKGDSYPSSSSSSRSSSSSSSHSLRSSSSRSSNSHKSSSRGRKRRRDEDYSEEDEEELSVDERRRRKRGVRNTTRKLAGSSGGSGDRIERKHQSRISRRTF